MTYQLTLRSRKYALGATVSASASASASASGSVSTECKAAATAFTKAATYFGLTSDAVTKTVQQCCQGAKDSNASTEERAKLVAECFARAAATAGAAAACVAGGITAPFAGVCGTVGAFMADRVMGYDKTQLAAGTAAGIVCAVATGGTSSTGCFYAAAEVVGWVGDKLGPAIEGIFNPGAAAEREWARRKAEQDLYRSSKESVLEAQKQIEAQWTASINRVWDLFLEAFPSNYYALARTKLGFGNDYQSIALQYVGAGLPIYIMNSAELSKHRQDTYGACEVYGKKVAGTYGPISPVCPPFLDHEFYKIVSSGARVEQIAQAAAELTNVANTFFALLPLTEAALASKIAVVAIAVKQQQALDEAKALSRAQLATRAASAAVVAAAAADAALKGNAEEGRRAVQKARNAYDKAAAAYGLLLDSFGRRTSAAEVAAAAMACAADASCKKAGVAVERAKASADLAVKNAASATTKRYAIGAGLAAAVAGGVYFFIRK